MTVTTTMTVITPTLTQPIILQHNPLCPTLFVAYCCWHLLSRLCFSHSLHSKPYAAARPSSRQAAPCCSIFSAALTHVHPPNKFVTYLFIGSPSMPVCMASLRCAAVQGHHPTASPCSSQHGCACCACCGCQGVG